MRCLSYLVSICKVILTWFQHTTTYLSTTSEHLRYRTKEGQMMTSWVWRRWVFGGTSEGWSPNYVECVCDLWISAIDVYYLTRQKVARTATPSSFPPTSPPPLPYLISTPPTWVVRGLEISLAMALLLIFLWKAMPEMWAESSSLPPGITVNGCVYVYR